VLLRALLGECQAHAPGGAVERAPGAGVRERLLTLPAEQRLPLALVDIAGLGYAEAAAVLGVTPEEVASRLAAGRRRLTVG
jgi:RNA polymerase sigma-70 factor (ECF subfamily)